MDGPQNAQQGFAGFNEIPDKDQPEDQPWPTADADWESSMQAMFALCLATGNSGCLRCPTTWCARVVAALSGPTSPTAIL